MEPWRAKEPPDQPEPVEPGWDLESTDFEPERLEVGPPAGPGRRARTVVVVGALALALSIVGIVGLSRSIEATAPEDADPVPTAAQSSRQLSWPTPRPATPTPPRPAVFGSSGFLADLDLDIYVRSSRAVFRIETRNRRVTRTAVDETTDVPVWFTAARDRVIVRPMDGSAGSAVVDNGGLVSLSGFLVDGAEHVPGPRGRIWVVSTDDRQSVARLTDATGRRSYELITVAGVGRFSADGAGGLFYTGETGGTYRATSEGLRRATRGRVVATSSRRFLTADCDERFVCRSYLYDRRTGDRRRAAGLAQNQQGTGTLSPDGRYAALAVWRDGQQAPLLEVVDLRTGRITVSLVLDEDTVGEPAAVWLPNGRLLGLSDSRLSVVDPRTGKATRSPIRLPPLQQMAVRGSAE